MIGIDEAIDILKNRYNVEAFEVAGILVIPVTSPLDIYDCANNTRRIFKEIGYEKSWQIDPYFFDKRQTLSDIMYNQNEGRLN